MLSRHKFSICVLLLVLIGFSARASSNSINLIRYGLIIGANNGGKNRERLQYAAKDAESFARVMQEMGGLLPGNSIILLDPNITRIEHAFTAIKRLIVHQNKSGVRQEFVFYYSGHSDEEGLLLNGEKLTYKSLRSLISLMPGDVRIAIIDSCASGIFIRTKGGVKRAPFIVDSSTEMKGYAFLTSSSETEAAQESDKIKGSFFTHYLIAGLRGAADVSQDKVVTLNEAYHYSFAETLARTEKTRHGPQHPSYDIQLTGTGDLVLTDLREVNASLIIEKNILGRIYIRNTRGDLVVELHKTTQSAMEIGLSPGAYTVTINDRSALYQAKVSLKKGRSTNLAFGDLKTLRPESAFARGGGDGEVGLEGDYIYDSSPFSFSLIPGFPSKSKENTIMQTVVSLNLTISVNDIINGCVLSLFGSTVLYDMHGFQGSGLYNIVWGNSEGASLSCIFNIAYANASYFQGSGIFNYTLGKLNGAQVSCVFNYTGMNVSGAQISGLWNRAEDVSGAQLTVGMNLAKQVQGVQLGLVNIAEKVDGLQLGLINISDENSGVAFGLFNYSRDGILNFELWQEWDFLSCVGFKFGTKYFYTIFLAGYDAVFNSDRWEVGIGWGFHAPIFDQLFIDTDILFTSVQPPESSGPYEFQKTLLPQLRLKIGYTLFSSFALFAGVNLHMYHPNLYYDKTAAHEPLFSIPLPDHGAEIAFVPKIFFGIQLLK